MVTGRVLDGRSKMDSEKLERLKLVRVFGQQAFAKPRKQIVFRASEALNRKINPGMK